MSECRAGWTQHIVAGLETLPAPTRDAVRKRVGPQTLERVEAALALQWFPLAIHVEVLEATREVLGETVYRRFWRDRTAAALDHPLIFGRVGRTVLRRFTDHPRRVVEAVPHALKHVVRDAGTMTVTTDEDATRVVLDGFPPELSGRGWADAWVGALDAIARSMAGEHAVVEITEHAPGRGRIEWTIAWGGALGGPSHPPPAN